jgi:hypothetical protein
MFRFATRPSKPKQDRDREPSDCSTGDQRPRRRPDPVGRFCATRLRLEISSEGWGRSSALALPGGVGAVVWDSEELASVRDSPHYECEAFWRFVPFDECEPIVRALITSNLAPLFDQLDAC